MEPILLLEGDPLIDCDGVAHSLYTLESPKSNVSIQESFCFKTCDKTFTFLELEKEGTVKKGQRYHNHLNIIKIQEIPHGLQNYGTGSLTWESSIIMSLYFTIHPDKLHGKILELGSGCGLGLLTWNVGNALDSRINSFTFTDYSTQVLTQCQENIQRHLNLLPFEINVQYLDWYDCQDDAKSQRTLMYDTLIASDVAYRNQDLEALKATIKQFLRFGSCAHIFGPMNRSTLQNLIHELEHDEYLDIETEVLKVSRRRLLSRDPLTDYIAEPDSTTILFLHISIRKRNVAMAASITSFNDID